MKHRLLKKTHLHLLLTLSVDQKMVLPSISFHLLSIIFMSLSSITAKQLFFLNTTFIFIFHNEKLFPLNFLISYFAAIAFHHKLTLLRLAPTISHEQVQKRTPENYVVCLLAYVHGRGQKENILLVI